MIFEYLIMYLYVFYHKYVCKCSENSYLEMSVGGGGKVTWPFLASTHPETCVRLFYFLLLKTCVPRTHVKILSQLLGRLHLRI